MLWTQDGKMAMLSMYFLVNGNGRHFGHIGTKDAMGHIGFIQAPLRPTNLSDAIGQPIALVPR
jgi:hypothetical protein